MPARRNAGEFWYVSFSFGSAVGFLLIVLTVTGGFTSWLMIKMVCDTIGETLLRQRRHDVWAISTHDQHYRLDNRIFNPSWRATAWRLAVFDSVAQGAR